MVQMVSDRVAGDSRLLPCRRQLMATLPPRSCVCGGRAPSYFGVSTTSPGDAVAGARSAGAGTAVR